MNINLLVAHTAEARPLINMLALRKVSDTPAMYANDSGLRLLVCGQGQHRATDGVRLLADGTGRSDHGWLNIGIAGHRSLQPGTCFAANKIVHSVTATTIYPVPFNHELPVSELHTVEQPELNYPLDVAYDMEAAGFFTEAARFTTLELVQCVKIVSDNPQTGIENINRNFVRELFEQNAGALTQFLSRFMALHELHCKSATVSAEIKGMMERLGDMHLTVTQKLQFQRLCQRLLAFALDDKLEQLLQPKNIRTVDAGGLLAQLNALLKRHEETMKPDVFNTLQ